jgi:hypothetical protein
MKVFEISLRGIETLMLDGRPIATIQLQTDLQWRIDGLSLQCEAGIKVSLPAVVDTSEQLECPRVFVVQGEVPDMFMLFGGVKAYWVSVGGKVLSELSLFRRSSEEEYWTTHLVDRDDEIIIIYEAGVLVVNDELQVRWHMPKYFNDDFVGIKGDSLEFMRDQNKAWFVRLKDGTLLQ